MPRLETVPWALALSALVGCSHPQPLPPSVVPFEENGALAVQWAGRGKERGVVEFQIVNATAFDLRVSGYAPDSFDPPLDASHVGAVYQVRVRRNGAWEPVELGWCGTGMARVMLDAGTVRHFSVAPPEPRDWDQMRVGITVSSAEGPHTVWSAPVNRDVVGPLVR